MNIDIQRTLPVIVSIMIIIGVAVLRNYSKTLAAITATMPINVPLALWIVYSGANGDQQTLIEFNQNMLLGIIPSLVFLAIAWWAARSGWSLPMTLGAGYVGWAVG
ncbi:MAG: hypothetical protein D6737_07110, partial [Chloroflexi bacterium]